METRTTITRLGGRLLITATDEPPTLRIEAHGYIGPALIRADLKFAAQLGATEVVGGNGLPTDKGYYTVADMTRLRERVEKAGLKLAVISGLPEELTYKIKLGLPGRDEQIDN